MAQVNCARDVQMRQMQQMQQELPDTDALQEQMPIPEMD